MATTSYLYHTLGVRGYVHLRSEFQGGRVCFHVQRAAHKRRCRNCGARWHRLRLRGRFVRTFVALPVGRHRQYVVLHGHRQECNDCGGIYREPIDFAPGRRRYLKAFGRLVLQMCRALTIKAVADLLGVGWDLVKQIHKEHLGKRLKKRKLSKLRWLAVDEFATHRGHVYMTVVLDLESGQIVHLQKGKDTAALLPFLCRLRRRCPSLRAVAVDLWDPYLRALRLAFGGKVEAVHDPYHVVALANRAIDETRREMMRRLPKEGKRVLKGSRFLLLRGLENLSENSLERLMRLMELNEPLYQAYLLKEQLRQFWNLPHREAGEDFLRDWIAQAQALGNRSFTRLAKTLDKYWEGLLSYFGHRISCGPLEGLNNKIKVLKRRAYGFRDMEYFKLCLYFLHEELERV